MTLTGGRPMKRIGFAFTDVVTGESVYIYEDYFGRTYIANEGFTLFRSGWKTTNY